jgi:hypothetical protein
LVVSQLLNRALSRDDIAEVEACHSAQDHCGAEEVPSESAVDQSERKIKGCQTEDPDKHERRGEYGESSCVSAHVALLPLKSALFDSIEFQVAAHERQRENKSGNSLEHVNLGYDAQLVAFRHLDAGDHNGAATGDKRLVLHFGLANGDLYLAEGSLCVLGCLPGDIYWALQSCLWLQFRVGFDCGSRF